MRLNKLAFVAFLLIWIMALPYLAVAQDTQPTATPSPTEIPILGEPTDESGAPALEGAPALSTTDGSQEQTFITPTAITLPESTAEVGATVAGPTCPTLVEDSFSALEQVCTGLSTGDACIGNGTIEGSSSVEGLQFSQPGDIARVTTFDALALRTANTPGTVWSVMTIDLELNSTDGNVPVGVQSILFGNVTVTDEGSVSGGSAQEATVIAGRGMNVRRTPDTTGVIVWQLQSGDQVIATGRTADDEWIRIQIPNQFQGIGWVYAPYLDVDGGAETLPFVTVNSPAPQLTEAEFGSMQSISLETANFPAECTDTPPSGMLMQTPSGLPDEVSIEVNGAEVTFNGAVFLQATAATALQVYVLEGQASVTASGTPADASSGTFFTVTLDGNSNASGVPLAAPFDVAEFESLPIRLLDRQFILTTSAPEEPETEVDSEEGFATPTEASGFGTSAPTNTPEACILTAPEVRNIRTGPGTDYEFVRALSAGGTVTAVGQVRGTDQLNWYQISDGNFIRSDSVTTSGACANLPLVTPPPTEIPQATDTPEASVFQSSELGTIACPGGQVSTSGTSDGSELYITLGGEWTMGAGTTATFSTQGGLLRPEFGDYIQLVAADGTIIANSSDGRNMTVSFPEQQTFTARFSAANGDVVVMSARCDS